MPIYEFQCQACGVEIEVLQKINDPHLTDCEACGKSEMKKKVTAAAFRLSGAGWYETDFKKENDKKKNLTDMASDSNKEKKSADTTKASKVNSNKGGDKASIKTETSTKESIKTKKDKAPSTD